MINKNLNKLSEQYLFSEISKIIKSRQNIINLSVGDVKLPLPCAVVEAGKRAAEELKSKQTFRGYSPETGYDFFKQAVVSYYARRGTVIDESEVFVSDGIKSDMSLFLNVIERCVVLLPSPCYPAYIDANIIRGNDIKFYGSFPPNTKADIIVICSPDNPTGRAMSRGELTEWVNYAKKNNSLILYDAAYEAFITNDAPRSIYEIEGARECAVEFCSLSKTAGFTGVRCGYTIVPGECGLSGVWRRVKSCLSNGVSYITQRMAECALTEALDETMANVKYYIDNAAIMVEALGGAHFSGGNSPYIWLRCGNSYDEFYKLLDIYGLGVTPGIGFGQGGEGYVRINAFCTRDDAMAAADRLKQYVNLR